MEPRTWQIVLTGGPCSGKTSGITLLADSLRERGVRVFVVPEVPTLLGSSDLGDITRLGEGDGERERGIERAVYRLRGALRAEFVSLAALYPDDTRVVLFDRAELDAAAYAGWDLLEQLCAEEGTTPARVRDSYDQVVHLVSAAHGASEHYTNDGHPARGEASLADAIDADARTLSGWAGHPHLDVVDNHTDFAAKLARARQHIFRRIGLPVPLAQRRWLVDHLPIPMPPSLTAAPATRLEQFWSVSPTPDHQVRYRRRSDGDLTTYVRSDLLALPDGRIQQAERAVTHREYEEQLALRDQSRPCEVKVRYRFVAHRRSFALDVFLEPRPLTILKTMVCEGDDPRIRLPGFLPVAGEITSAHADRLATGRI